MPFLQPLPSWLLKLPNNSPAETFNSETQTINNLREVTVAGVHLVIFSTSKITLLLKIIYMLTNFLILSNTLPFKYCSLNMYFEGNLDSANKFNNIT